MNSLNNGSRRCFCNLPSCISSSYMCISPSGGCFSDLSHYSSPQSVYHARHGCVELLTDKLEKDWCQRHPSSNPHMVRRKNSHPRSLLYCCNHDMCNHADDPQTRDLINDTTSDDNFGGENRLLEGQWSDAGGYNSADVWFKAATIAVPICGAVILFVLVALAIRLLRTESCQNDDCKLGCSYEKKNSDKRDHFHAAQKLLFREPLPSPSPPHFEIHRHALRTPIVLKKETNLVNARNFFDPEGYGLLPQDIARIHAGYTYNEKNLDSCYAEKSDK